LVHASLAVVPLDASEDQVRQIVSLYARVLGAEDQEVTAALAVMRATLDHPLLRRALKAQVNGFCRRETPMTLTLEDGTLVEGVLDLAFLQDGLWTVVDFKTDRELKKEREN
jgi:ATP-dependent helicase/nuclease subunit A